MQPVYEKVNTTPDSSITAEDIYLPYFISQWHYHPEIEIIQIIESTGTLFIGNSMHRFSPGTVAIIGSNVPHVWLNDKEYYENKSGLTAHSQVVKFKKDFLGSIFLELPEMKPINNLLSRASRGLMFDPSLNKVLIPRISTAIKVEGMHRIIEVFQILNLMAQSKSYKFLSSSFENVNLTVADCQRIDKVYKYLIDNSSNEIRLFDIANIANMNISAFCRYFKTHTLKTLSEVINEIRIAKACTLLAETNESISEICFKSGFNYTSNFYKQFEKIKQMAPGRYRQALSEKKTEYDSINLNTDILFS